MKKLLLFVCFFCGCASLEPTVDDNVFHSSIPSLDMRVDSEFKYIGFHKAGKLQRPVSSSPSAPQKRIEKNYYFFVSTKQDNVQKTIVIQFLSLKNESGYFIADGFREQKGKLVSETCNLAGRKYDCCTILDIARSENTKQFLYEKGYAFPEYGLSRGFYRTAGTKRAICIWYFESLENTRFPCNSWNDFKSLSDSQKKHLREFATRAETVFEIQ